MSVSILREEPWQESHISWLLSPLKRHNALCGQGQNGRVKLPGCNVSQITLWTESRKKKDLGDGHRDMS